MHGVDDQRVILEHRTCQCATPIKHTVSPREIDHILYFKLLTVVLCIEGGTPVVDLWFKSYLSLRKQRQRHHGAFDTDLDDFWWCWEPVVWPLEVFVLRALSDKFSARGRFCNWFFHNVRRTSRESTTHCLNPCLHCEESRVVCSRVCCRMGKFHARECISDFPEMRIQIDCAR